MKKKRIVVKVGTNVLTRKNLRLNYNRISDLVRQISTLKKDNEILLVSSGAAGAGREIFQFKEEKDPLIRKQMLSSIGQGRLFQVYADFFREHSFIVSQALLTRRDFHSKTGYANMKSTLEGLLANGIIPIINENDVVSSQEYSFGDNDQLAALTSALMEVDLLIILSDIVGLYSADPKKDSKAQLIPYVEKIDQKLINFCEETISQGGTGGMFSKIKAAELATQHGISTVVASGKKENILLKIMKGSFLGTTFQSHKRKKLSVKGSWMNCGAFTRGVLTIDSGAKQALSDNKSLLAVGVERIEGKFKKGEVILIKDKENIRLGAGLANIDSDKLNEIISQKQTRGIIAIHKNHLYTLQ